MTRKLEDVLQSLPEKRQQAIREEANRLIEVNATLGALRKALNMTQSELADRLGSSQVAIAQLEKRSDIRLSTLQSYVAALGGQLRLNIDFGDGRSVELVEPEATP